MFAGNGRALNKTFSTVSPGKHLPSLHHIHKKELRIKMNKATKLAKTKEATLEGIVQKHERSRVYVLSEVGYDTAYFNQGAYENLLKFMSQDKDITGIIVDGAVTRLDRPEYLNDELTYWNKTEEQCREATESIPNSNQYMSMMQIQMSILETRLRELKQRMPNAKIVFSLDSDDTQYTISAMVNEMLIRKQTEIIDELKGLKTEQKTLNTEYKHLSKEYSALGNSKKSASIRSGMKRRMSSCKSKLKQLGKRISEKTDEGKLYREKKVRPAHQYLTKEFVAEMYKGYKDMCDRIGVELVTSPSILNFKSLNVDYAHSRHSTWAVMKRRDRALLSSTHGKMDRYQSRLFDQMKDSCSKGIDVIVESGHAGIGYKQFQKTSDTPAETNFKNQSVYDPEIGRDGITLVMVLPFEDQEKIGRFVTGKEPERISAGKPINTRKHAAVDRYTHDGVTGLTVITKDSDGIVGTEWVQYKNFSDGSVLNQPKEYSIICASSDEHIGSPEENVIAREGWMHLYSKLLLGGESFRGRNAAAKGFIDAGDAAEANSKKWDHRYHYKRDPQEVMRENIELLSKFKPESVEDVIKLAMKMTNDARGGSVESMAVILERVADYYESFLKGTLEHSRLKWAHVSTTGNHADEVLKDTGFRESDFFAQRMKSKGIGIYEVGKPDYVRDNEGARVFLGGYSNARVLNIPDYGLDTEGKEMFGPINLVVQHDPKGSGFTGLVGAGKNSNADLALGGHTHDNWMKIYKTGDNSFSVAYKLATLQTVSPTEKYYASSVPRTQAAHCLIIPMKGDFAEKAIPSGRLNDIGRNALYEKAEQEMKKK